MGSRCLYLEHVLLTGGYGEREGEPDQIWGGKKTLICLEYLPNTHFISSKNTVESS